MSGPVRTLALEYTSALDKHPTGVGRYVVELGQALIRLRPADRQLSFVYRASRWKRREHLPPASPGVRRQMQVGTRIWPPPARLEAIICPAYRLVPWPAPRLIGVMHDLYAALGLNHDPEQTAKMIGVYTDMVRRSAAIACVSEHTRQDLLRFFPELPAARTRVIQPGLPEIFARAAPDAVVPPVTGGRPYVLFVGLGNPNKNLPRLLDAFARSQAGRKGTHDIVLVGPSAPPDVEATLARAVADLGLGNRLKRTGFLPDDALPGLYAHASAFAFPSLYEGFGTPILEAMAMGTPVLTSRTSACPETAAGHAVLADPTDVDDLARGLDEALGLPPERRAAARAHARGMTYDRTAQGFYDLLDELADTESRSS